MNKGVSVVVCCYNSASRLPDTLSHLARQVVSPSIGWEVIIVDNASLDNTAEVASQCWEQLSCDIPLRVVNEQQPGLSCARQRGFTSANYDYIVWCDDDNWLSTNYISIAFDILESNTGIGVLGGIGEAICELTPPDWFATFQGNYAVGKQAECSGDLTDDRAFVYGAGAVFRKSALAYLENNDFSSFLSDRKGEGLTSGGDVELCYALKLAGYRIWYDERLRFKHFIPKGRLTWKYLERMFASYGNGEHILMIYRLIFVKPPVMRKRYKNTWQWFLLMQVILLLKNHFWRLPSYFFSSIRSHEALFIGIKVNTIKSLYLQRAEFKQAFRYFQQSPWIHHEHRLSIATFT